jgi:hypothetical protein
MKNNCYISLNSELNLAFYLEGQILPQTKRVVDETLLAEHGHFIPNELLKEYQYYKERLDLVIKKIRSEATKEENLLRCYKIGM